MITYLCECGCENTKNQLVRKRLNRDDSIRLRCKIHSTTTRGNIVKRYNICTQCGSKFEVKVSGRAPYKCNQCSYNKQIGDGIIDSSCFFYNNIIPILGEVINIYECGCIIPNKYDEKKIAYSMALGKSIRVCPFHEEPKRLISKFKKCKTCGFEHQGWTLQASTYCQRCPKEIKKQVKGKVSKYKNNARRDNSRDDCKHRQICIMKYIKYAAIPCLDCPDYEQIPFEIDPYRTVNSWSYNKKHKVCL